MSLKLRFLPHYREDLADRLGYYESRVPGLGSRFAHVVDDAVTRIIRSPTAFAFLESDIRKFSLHPFQDLLVYHVSSERIVFLGVVHGARELKRWLRGRLRESTQ